MPGSDRLQRTPPRQTQWLEEKAQSDEVIQLALVFQDGCGVLYRNGEVYASYDIADPVTFSSGSSLLIGLRHTRAARQNGFFRGRVLDARVYEVALSAQQLNVLKPDVEGRPQPLAWHDFADGKTRDRTGNFPHGMLFGNARIENGELVLDRGDYFKVPGTLNTQVRMTSPDVENWAQVEEPFITSDKKLNICPNIFQFGRWHYYICGSGVWRSHGAFGPWTEHKPLRLDNLAVSTCAPRATKAAAS